MVRGYFFRVLLFCIFRSSKFGQNWVYRVKKPLGLQNRSRFEKGIFALARCTRKFDVHWHVASSLAFGVVAKNGLAAVVWRVFASFRFFLFEPVFANFKWSSSHPPLFAFVCFLIFCAFFLGLGSTQPCTRYFWALGRKPSLFVCFLLSFYKNTGFSPEKGVILVHFSVSPFLSPWLLSLLFVTLSLSLSFLFLVFFLPSCLVFHFFFLVFCCSFLSCFFAFVS